MTQDHDDRPDANQPRHGSNPFGSKQRQEPVLTGFDEEEDEGYEEPDRDTDYASGYREDSIEEEEYDDFELGADEDESDTAPGQTEWVEPLAADPVDDAGNEPDEWADNERYPEADSATGRLPLGLIAVAVVALLLLAAGGYGVMQQRSATQEEIRQLQATLATSASPADVTASRKALQEIKVRNAELQAATDALVLKNQRLATTVTELESQLEVQQAALAQQAADEPAKPPATPPPVEATPKPAAAAPAPKPAAPAPPAPKPPAAASTGVWFVNFSSYGQRATAQNWAAKLHPATGKVIIATGAKDGKTIYRVRVVELASKETADKVARQLAAEHGLPKLWVGRQ